MTKSKSVFNCKLSRKSTEVCRRSKDDRYNACETENPKVVGVKLSQNHSLVSNKSLVSLHDDYMNGFNEVTTNNCFDFLEDDANKGGYNINFSEDGQSFAKNNETEKVKDCSDDDMMIYEIQADKTKGSHHQIISLNNNRIQPP